MKKIFILCAGCLLLAAGCNSTQTSRTTTTSPDTVTSEECPNSQSKPCNGQLPTQTTSTIAPPPTQPNSTQQPTPPTPTPPSATVAPPGPNEISLTVGQTTYPGSIDTAVTLKSLAANSATITFGCKNATPKTFTLKVGESVNLKPDCTTALTLTRTTTSTAVFQVTLVR